MRALKRLAVVLPLALVMLLGACGTSYLTATPGVCKGYSPQMPPLIQNYYYDDSETQTYFAIPSNSTLILVDDSGLQGRVYVLYPAPTNGGNVKISGEGTEDYRGAIVQITVVDNTNVKPMLEWMLVNAYHNHIAVAQDYEDAKGNEVSAAAYFGLNPCVDNLYQD